MTTRINIRAVKAAATRLNIADLIVSTAELGRMALDEERYGVGHRCRLEQMHDVLLKEMVTRYYGLKSKRKERDNPT